ncbi:MAG: branched-chain amino acid ABC transporter permease [Christensenellales bacterium]|nr:branched-chain amino acid ABC transporter permease [Christensenellaceae bacterium]
MSLFINQLINGVHVGSIYALIALGYTMVYGIIRLINFAHGDILMVGAYTVVVAIGTLGLSPLAAILISIVICTLFGILIEKIAYKPLRNSPKISSLITAIGVSMLLQNIALLVFTPTPKPYPVPLSVEPLNIGGIQVSFMTVLTFGVSIAIMLALQAFVTASKAGKSMRAVSEDVKAALLMGINTDNTITLTFAIGCALAGVGSALFCLAYPSVSPTMGSLPGVKAFIAAVLGGIGVIPGAMLGGFLLGIAESFTKAYISSQLSDAVVYGILIVVLLFKPSGLLGKSVREKV